MGKKSDPPKPPDPKETAAAQTETNINTAMANNAMGMINQVGPDGSLTYSQTGSHTWTDPTTGRTFQVPTYTATTELSESAQAIRDQTNDAQLNLATMAANQSARADDLLSTPFDLNGIPDYARRGGGPARYSETIDGPRYQKSDASLPDLSQAGAIPGQRQGDGFRGYTPAPGRSDFQRFDEGGAGLETSYIDDFSEDRQRVEDGLMGRLNTQFDEDLDGMRTQLLNRGVQEGTEAFDREMRNFEDRRTRARLDAMLAAGQEQSRLAGLSRDQAMFGNSARQQDYLNRFGETQYNNGLTAQEFDQGMSLANMSDRRRETDYSFGVDERRYQDAADLQRFGMGEDVRRYDDMQRIGQYDRGQQQLYYNNNLEGQDFADRMNLQQRDDSVASSRWMQEQQIMDARDRQRGQLLQEQFALRNQPINEISALLSGSQVGTPNFDLARSAQMPTVDYAGMQQQNYANQMQQYQLQQQQQQALMGGLFGLAGAGLAGGVGPGWLYGG